MRRLMVKKGSKFEIFKIFLRKSSIFLIIGRLVRAATQKQMTRRAELNSLAVGSKSNTGSAAIDVPPRPRRCMVCLGVAIDNLS